MYRIFCVTVLILLGVACEKESDLTPGEGAVNYFEVPADATDEESVLRREFQKETGSYLLFNDTLRKELLGRDEDGFPLYSFETVELGYGIVSSAMDKFSFHYLENMEVKRAGAKFVQDRLLSLMDKSLAPYSILLVKTVMRSPYLTEEGESDGFYGESDPINYYSGTRCMAISIGDILNTDEEEQDVLMKNIVVGMINNILGARPSVMTSFYASGNEYYGKSGYMYYDLDLYIDDLRELGFITGYFEYDYYEDDYYIEFPSQSEDISSFLEVMFGDEEAFLEENAEYPLVIEKYNLLKKIVKDLGFRLDLL